MTTHFKDAANVVVEAVNDFSATLRVAHVDFTYEDTTVTAQDLPEDAIVVGVAANTTEAFTGGLATTIDVGVAGALADFADDLNVRSAGVAVPGTAWALDTPVLVASDAALTVTVTTDDTAGAGVVKVFWIAPQVGGA